MRLIEEEQDKPLLVCREMVMVMDALEMHHQKKHFKPFLGLLISIFSKK